MGHAARPDTLIREGERLAAQTLQAWAGRPPPADDRGATERLGFLGHAADYLFNVHQVRWQNRIGDHHEVARRVLDLARAAAALRRRFPAASTAYPFHRAAWLGYLAEGAFDDDLVAQFPPPDDLSACRVDYPLHLADGCLLRWVRAGAPHPDWEDFLGGRFRRGLPTVHLCDTYRAYTDIVAAVLGADAGRFAGGVAEAERLYDGRWRLNYTVPEGGPIGNPKARGRDVRLAALLELARRSRPDWASACDRSPHRWGEVAGTPRRPGRSPDRPSRGGRRAEPRAAPDTGRE